MKNIAVFGKTMTSTLTKMHKLEAIKNCSDIPTVKAVYNFYAPFLSFEDDTIIRGYDSEAIVHGLVFDKAYVEKGVDIEEIQHRGEIEFY